MEEQFNDVKRLVKEAGIERPSSGFSINVMQDIKRLSAQEPIVYTPLISKRAWFWIGILIFGLVLSLAFLTDNNTSILDKIDLSSLQLKGKLINNPFKDFTLYKTTLYGILFFSILFFVQIPILKRRIDKSFSL